MKIILALVLSLISQGGWAQKNEFQERVVEVMTDEKNPSVARNSLLNQAADKVAEDLVKEMIGEPRFLKEKSALQNRVLSKSSQFLPLSRPGELRPQPEGGFAMTVAVRASLDVLQRLLMENGFLYETDSLPVILPWISWVDQTRGQKYSWWQPGSSDSLLRSWSLTWETQLAQAGLRNGFFVTRPQTLQLGGVGDEDPLKRAKQIGAQLLVKGEIELSSPNPSSGYRIRVNLFTESGAGAKRLAEVTRQFETDSGNYDLVVEKKLREVQKLVLNDLMGQIAEAWKQGALLSESFLLKFDGALTIPMQEALKQELRSKARELRTVRERFISNDSFVVEVEASVPLSNLVTKLKEFSLLGSTFSFQQQNGNEASWAIKKSGAGK